MNICVKFKTSGWDFTLHQLGNRVLLEYYVFVDGIIVMCSELSFEFWWFACLENVLYLCMWYWILCLCFCYSFIVFYL